MGDEEGEKVEEEPWLGRVRKNQEQKVGKGQVAWFDPTFCECRAESTYIQRLGLALRRAAKSLSQTSCELLSGKEGPIPPRNPV